MKKTLLLISIISILFLTACGQKDKTNENDLPTDSSGENTIINNSDNEIIIGDDSEVFSMSFEDRTKPFFDKKEETSGDRMRKEFNVIRISKVDNHYELRASMLGDVKIGLKALESAMNQVADKTLHSIDIELDNGDCLTLYGSRPQEIVDIYKEIGETKGYWDPYDIKNFDDSDWSTTMNKSKWMNKDGLPMYTYFKGRYDIGWARLQYVEDDGYYLMGRDLAGKNMDWFMSTINEEEALCINLLPDDKIVLDIANPTGILDEILYADLMVEVSGEESGDTSGETMKQYNLKTMTVEEYYNLSINNGYEYRTEDGYFINITNMSDDNVGDIGLDVKDGAIYVFGKYVGP